ncbi:MAG: ABC transporter substrate-binding protein [Solirubrobacteraceae bacterium]|nr:ABC transporter substrate-binding protein [Solirubrobacteraceae bacterium]
MASPTRVVASVGALATALLLTGAGAPAGAAPSSQATAADRTASPVARIYVSLPRQGRAAPSAALIARGLRAATTARGSRAGGHRIRLVWLDDATGDRWDATKVRANARRAAADPTAIAYVGEGDSEATALAMPIVNRAGLAHLSPVSTATELTAPDRAGELQPSGVRTFFRPIPDDARQGAALVTYARSLGVRRSVMVVDDDGLYGRGLTRSFAADGARRGVRVVGRRVVSPSGHGLAAAVRAVRARRPHAVVYGGSPSSGAAKVIRALHAASPRTLVLGGEALANDAFARRLGAARSVMRLTTPAAHADPRARRTHRLGRRPAAFTVFAHNGMTALLRAIDRAGRRGGVTRASVRDAVFDGSVQTGLSGPWTIDADGGSGYGVFNTARLGRSGVLTTGERAVTRLVRREADRLRRRAAAPRRLTRTPTRTTRIQTSGTTPIIPTELVGPMDIETMLRMVQEQRTRLLDEQLREQLAAVQARNQRIARLNVVLSRLAVLEAAFPAGAAATTPTGTDGAWPTLTAAVRTAADEAGITDPPDVTTLADVRAAIARIKALVDDASGGQQLEMLRLQSLTNKRNEAFDVMTDFVKRMQDARASIIANMR